METHAAPVSPLLGPKRRGGWAVSKRRGRTPQAAGEAGDTPLGVGPDSVAGPDTSHSLHRPIRSRAGVGGPRVTSLLFASAVLPVSCSSLSISCFLFLVAKLSVPAWLANRGYSSSNYVHLSKDLATKNTAGYFSVVILKLYQRTDQHCLLVLPQPAMGQACAKPLLSGLGNSTVT